MEGMSLRRQLFLMNVASLAIIIGALSVSYQKMLLSLHETLWLTGITLSAGTLSFLAYRAMTRPLVGALDALVAQTDRIANRDFDAAASPPLRGPREIRQLSKAFAQMQGRLEESFAELADAEQARRELVANISHDLRTPITCIVSFIDAIQDGTVSEEESRTQYLATIERESKRLDKMIHNLFELSSLDAGREHFEPEYAHVEQVIVDSLERHERQFVDKQLTVIVDIPNSLPMLWMHPDFVARIIGNLLQNAIRHTPPGGKITIGVRPLSSAVEVAVRDTGPGIAATERERVFERFYRLDKSRNQESGGAGLGLAIAQSLVKLHGGDIGVRATTEEGTGAEFWFQLPVS